MLIRTRKLERQSRPTESQRTDPLRGVVITPSSIDRSMELVGQTTSGSVCDSPELQASHVRITPPRRASVGSGCLHDLLGGYEGLRLSTNSAAPPGSGEVEAGIGRSDTHWTLVSKESMVTGSTGPLSRGPESTTSLGEASSPARVEHFSPQSQHPPASRLESIAQSVTAAGFSEEVAMGVSRGKLRPSSLKVYDSHWSIFSTWCRFHQIDPWTVSVSQIADFLLELFRCNTEKFEPSRDIGQPSHRPFYSVGTR